LPSAWPSSTYLGKIQVPILALVATDSYKKGLSDEAIRSFYRHVFANAPRASIILIHNARHFLAVDQPDAVGATIEAFLAGLNL
jgi:N-formylmaleamate deformylase